MFDLINALLKPKGLQLKHMWREASKRLEFVESEKMNVYLLQVMSLLAQAYCSPKYLYFLLPGEAKSVREPDGTLRKEVLVPDVDDFVKRWDQAVDSLEDAIKLIRHPQEFGAISPRFLPYVSILPVFAALQAHVKAIPPERRLDAQRKIRHWYWASVFMNRYSGSVESTSARDYLDVKAWVDENSSEPALIQEFKSRFSGLELRKETKRGTSVYNGVFNLFIVQGAPDWITGTVPQHDDLDDHHIVPASWGAKHIDGPLIHTILNKTPLTGATNRHVIGDKLPNVYLPELVATNGEDRIRGILEAHFISPAAFDILLRDPFSEDDFEAFITERQRTLQQAIESLLIKERLDLSPDLRELDAQVEEIELKLRSVIAERLSAGANDLPQRVLRHVDERVQRAAKKSAAMDSDHYQTLDGMLEFCDLRELEATIVNRELWANFENLFTTKEALAGKFGQLAELRNAIRHSRRVDDVTKKEGEAAIIWFETALNR